MAEKLLLIDGPSLFHRAFHALPPLTTSDGQPTNALYGFLQMVMPLLEEERPDYALVALDLPGPTFRDEIYEEYKAQRPPTDEALKEQVPLLQDVIEALGLQAMGVEGFEADDVIGTLARQAADEGKQVTIVTGDRDLLQLVDDSIEVVATLRGIKETKRYDVEQVREEYGLSPRQLIDLKALSGDSSDNIPGVPGIGDKSALTLLEQFGSVEAAIERMDEIESTRIRNRLEEAPEAAELSKRLARIETEAPIDRELEELAWDGLPVEKLRDLAMRLEFTSLLDRLPQNKEAELELHVEPVRTQEELEELAAAVREAGAMELALSDDE
ncbi:MAG: 5'-3' exonuclease, partial [Armatimonadota bacterium]